MNALRSLRKSMVALLALLVLTAAVVRPAMAESLVYIGTSDNGHKWYVDSTTACSYEANHMYVCTVYVDSESVKVTIDWSDHTYALYEDGAWGPWHGFTEDSMVYQVFAWLNQQIWT